ncbi:hypothetical protein ACN4EG_20775 [Alkalinema pantanalense CENA528]|uniref:hypothetical protein n=1 Tax=Alkalinema pantanalense TaxID=1620705 RepID=UPI003D6E403B
MSLIVRLSDAGNWRLMFLQTFQGDINSWRNYRIPAIDIIEIPFTIAGRILTIGATYIEARPTWRTAGTMVQEVAATLDDTLVFPGISGGSTAIDTARRNIPLNTTALQIFPRYASEHRYRFEPNGWIPRLTLGIWEYIGTEGDEIADQLESIKVDLTRIEVKVDGLTP